MYLTYLVFIRNILLAFTHFSSRTQIEFNQNSTNEYVIQFGIGSILNFNFNIYIFPGKKRIFFLAKKRRYFTVIKGKRIAIFIG